jgi:DnaJ-class molecular chaperone
MKKDDLYKVLELDITYDKDIIKRAYRKLTIRHSDNDNKIKELTNAYNIILNDLSNKDTIKMNYLINNESNTEILTNYNSKNTKNTINNDIIETNNYFYIQSDICIEQQITYEECYFGSSIPVEINRYIYNNNIITEEKETIYIEIPIGIDDNEIILLKKKGNIYKDTNFDVKVRIKLISHKLFTRKGLDLIYNKNITLLESLIGFSFTFIHINKKKYMIKINEITRPNSNRIIDNMGFIRNNYTGKLIINYEVIYPKSLIKENIEILKKILI